MRILTLLFIFVTTVSVDGIQGQVVTYENHPAIQRILHDYAGNEIGIDESIRQQFYVVFDPERVAPIYREGLDMKLKCATPLMMRYDAVRASLSNATVETVDALVKSPFEFGPEAVYISPGGRFQLTYQTTGTHAVPTTDVNPPNGIPDYVERCAEYFDYCWLKEIDTLGFAGPYNSATRRYQIGFESMGAYGYTTTTGDSVGTRIVVHNNFNGFPPNDDPDGNQLGAMKVTNAHEFKHASQFTNSHWNEGGWVELDATWMEDIAYDATNDYYNYIEGTGSPFTSPGTALDAGGTGSYEDCNWQHYMSEKHGNPIITDLWMYRQTHQFEPMLTSYNNILMAYGSSLAEAFKEYATWNMMTGGRATAGFGYGEAGPYPTSALCRTHTALPANGVQCTLGHLAANFIRINSDNSPMNLHVAFNGPVGEEMGLMLVYRHAAGGVSTIDIPLDASNVADFIAPVRLNHLLYVGLIPVITQLSGGGFGYSYAVDAVPGLSITHDPLSGVVDSAAFYPVTAQIVSHGVALDTQQIYLHYGVGGVIADSMLMTPVGLNGEFAGNIPDLGSNLAVRYYLSAADTSGLRVNLPAPAPIEYFQFSIGSDVIPPVIVHNVPTDLSRDEMPYEVLALVRDDVLLDTVVLAYKHNGVPLGTLGMHRTNGDTFSVILPLDSNQVDIGDSLEYRIVAWDAGVWHNADSTEWYKSYIYGSFTLIRTVSLSIPDNIPSGVTDTMGVLASLLSPEPLKIADLDVVFKATHPYVGDLIVKLKSPSGQTLTLMNRPGPGAQGSSGDNPDVVLDDEALTSIESISHTGTQQVTGRYRPDPQSLSLLDGEDVSGNWILQVIDARSSNAGTLDQWGFKVKTLATSVVTSVELYHATAVPSPFALEQNYPNPFNPTTTIRYGLAAPGEIKLVVYNILGQRIRTLVSGAKAAGMYATDWDGKDDHGVSVASGIYFYRLLAGHQSVTRKMIFVK